MSTKIVTGNIFKEGKEGEKEKSWTIVSTTWMTARQGKGWHAHTMGTKNDVIK